MLVRLVQALALNSNSWQQHANVSSNQSQIYIHTYHTFKHTCMHTYIRCGEGLLSDGGLLLQRVLISHYDELYIHIYIDLHTYILTCNRNAFTYG